MIVEVQGDMLLSKADLIVHGVAANDPITQGLAKSLHERMPAMHKEFHHWWHHLSILARNGKGELTAMKTLTLADGLSVVASATLADVTYRKSFIPAFDRRIFFHCV